MILRSWASTLAFQASLNLTNVGSFIATFLRHLLISMLLLETRPNKTPRKAQANMLFPLSYHYDWRVEDEEDIFLQPILGDRVEKVLVLSHLEKSGEFHKIWQIRKWYNNGPSRGEAVSSFFKLVYIFQTFLPSFLSPWSSVHPSVRNLDFFHAFFGISE